jgi:hypothetical protein
VNVKVYGNVAPMNLNACNPQLIYAYNVWDGPTCSSTDISAPLAFVDPANYDFHLKPGAAAINHGDPFSFPGVDIDGQTRPMGAAPDAGADEAG